MKRVIRFALFLLWIFAIITPSMVTLWDADNKVVINAFNEEEQQEQGKKDQLEEKIISEGNSNFDFLAFSKKSTISNFSKIAQFDYTVEIHLPPPEQPL